MPGLDTQQILAHALDEMQFPEDELGFLVLTSKSELHFRDRLAWQLHNDVADLDIGVAREWPGRGPAPQLTPQPPRIDLGLLDGEDLDLPEEEAKPLALLQAKTFNSFNTATEMKPHVTDLRRNLRQAWDLGTDADVFALLVVPHAAVPEDPEEPVPGQLGYRKFWRRYWANGANWHEMESRIEELFDAEVECHRRTFDAVKALGSQVTVRVWLWGPIPADAEAGVS